MTKTVEETIAAESRNFDEELMGYRNASASYAEVCDPEDNVELVLARWWDAFLASCALLTAVEAIREGLLKECHRREKEMEDEDE
jgi:hypothetical protein